MKWTIIFSCPLHRLAFIVLNLKFYWERNVHLGKSAALRTVLWGNAIGSFPQQSCAPQYTAMWQTISWFLLDYLYWIYHEPSNFHISLSKILIFLKPLQKISHSSIKLHVWSRINTYIYQLTLKFVVPLVKNPPAMRETWVLSLGWEDPLEKAKATHSSILAWRIPWTI